MSHKTQDESTKLYGFRVVSQGRTSCVFWKLAVCPEFVHLACEMEITTLLVLSEEESSLLDMHSVLNVLNCVNYELLLLSEQVEEKDELLALIDDVADAGDLLRDPVKAMALVTGVEDLIQRIEMTLDGASKDLDANKHEFIRSHRDNLANIYAIIRIRAREIVARHRSPDVWINHSIDELKGKFVEFLAAVEQNSHGRYRFVRNLAAQGESDYLIQFEITSTQDDTLCMPMIFQDVMRDLLANARKYTPLGGRIQGGLHADQDGLRFVLQDNGIGIPKEAIQDVVLFGRRAENVAERITRGGGFGLTKAYYVTRRYRGRMWIDSATQEEGGQGTRIEIRIPYP